MTMRRVLLGVTLFFLLSVSMAGAQPPVGDAGECPALVEQALTAAGESCVAVGRNQVCYGHNMLQADDLESLPLTDFSASGDLVDVAALSSLRTAAMDLEAGVWGVALMALQANLPDTLPGQNVVFVVYGDAALRVDDMAADDFGAPMQAFTLTTGIGEPQCREAPRDGVLVQSPEGTTVNFLVNGIEVEMSSTVRLDFPTDMGSMDADGGMMDMADGKLWVSTLEGEARVTSAGVTQVAAQGEIVVTEPGQSPGDPAPMRNEDIRAAPVSLLPVPVPVPFMIDPRAGTEGWIESDIVVEAGRSYILSASGEINLFDGCTPEGMEGTGLTCDDMILGVEGLIAVGPMDDVPLPGAFVGVPIARIGEDGAPFQLTAETVLTAAQDGVLHFRINDQVYPEDNTGAFMVIVTPTE